MVNGSNQYGRSALHFGSTVAAPPQNPGDLGIIAPNPIIPRKCNQRTGCFLGSSPSRKTCSPLRISACKQGRGEKVKCRQGFAILSAGHDSRGAILSSGEQSNAVCCKPENRAARSLFAAPLRCLRRRDESLERRAASDPFGFRDQDVQLHSMRGAPGVRRATPGGQKGGAGVKDVVSAPGLEPGTSRLKVVCSTS